MLVKSARAIELHWTTEPLVWSEGAAIEVPDALVPQLLAYGGFAVVAEELEAQAAGEQEQDPAPVVKPARSKKKEG